MADQLRNHTVRRPRRRVIADDPGRKGYFYPGEVAKMEGLAEIDYRQLRRLFRLVRWQSGEHTGAERTWSRYTLRDIAALRIAVDLCRNEDAPLSRYLLIAPLERACSALSNQGVANPLLDVPMVREGRTIFAEVDGIHVDPVTGQMRLRDVHDSVRRYLDESDITVPAAERAAVRAAVSRESAYRGRATAPAGGLVAL